MNRFRQYLLWSVIPTLSLMLLTFALAVGATSNPFASANGTEPDPNVIVSEYDDNLGVCLDSVSDKVELAQWGGTGSPTTWTDNPVSFNEFWNTSTLDHHPPVRRVEMKREGNTLKVLLFARAWKEYQYFFIPNDLPVPESYMFIGGAYNVQPSLTFLGTDISESFNWVNKTTKNKYLNMDLASELYGRNKNFSGDFNEISTQITNEMAPDANTKLYGFLGKWRDQSGDKTFTPAASELNGWVVTQYNNTSDFKYIYDQVKKGGVYNALDALGDKNNNFPKDKDNGANANHVMAIHNHWLESQQMVAMYFEIPDVFSKWKDKSPVQTFGYAMKGGFSAEGGGAVFNYKLDAERTKLHGYFDTPYLTTSLYGNENTIGNNSIPVGMQIRGRYTYTVGDAANAPSKKIENVSVVSGGKCITFKDGVVDFSRKYNDNGTYEALDSNKAIMDSLGQSTGRDIYFHLPADAQKDKVRFNFDVYKDSSFKELADWTGWEQKSVEDTDTSMRTGYMQLAEGGNGKKVVKVRYFRDPYNINKGDSGLEQTVRLRPYVLNQPDAELPYNPVGITPYREMIKWIGSDNQALINGFFSNKGAELERVVIPGFLKVKCKMIEAWQSHGAPAYEKDEFDPWASGTYYEDGGEWIIGDDQKLAIHNKYNNPPGESKVTLQCWGVQEDPNRTGGQPTNVPLNGYVILDAESTDGQVPNGPTINGEELSVTSDVAEKAYPIFGFSSCNSAYGRFNFSPAAGWSASDSAAYENVFADYMTRPGTISYTNPNASGDGHLYTWVGGTELSDHEGYIELKNPKGRCGQMNSSIIPGYSGVKFDNKDYGMLFGPNLMAVAPNARRDMNDILAKYNKNSSWADYLSINKTIRDEEAKSYVKLYTKNGGRQAVMFGVIIPADTSNADYNNMMPPVAQYSSMRFKQGLSEAGKDYTLPENYNNNYYYYASRLGAKAKAYDPNNNTLGAGFKPVRDGSSNDGLDADDFELLLGHDIFARQQPKVKAGSHPMDFEGSRLDRIFDTGVLGKDAKTKYYLGKDTKQLVEKNGQWSLQDSDTNNQKPLTVTVPCGPMYEAENVTGDKGKTHIRGWADFNGNGVFDPEEASTLATCDPTKDEPGGNQSLAIAKNDLRWTKPTSVTITFNYPTTHKMNSKRNVWMRLRAVGDSKTDVDLLSDNSVNTRSASDTHAATPRIVNPDEGTIGTGPSSLGSWDFALSGEAEDYLFDITPNPVSQSDYFCIQKDSGSVVFNPLENDMRHDNRVDVDNVDHTKFLDRTDKRQADPKSVVFLAKQADGVVVSDGGKTATVDKQGTYTIDPNTGQITFVPVDEFKNSIAEGKNVKLTRVTYAFHTKEEDTVYDAITATSDVIDGEGSTKCGVKAEATTDAIADITYQWGVDKEILNPDTKQWAKEFSLSDKDHAITKVDADYRLKVDAKAVPTCVKRLNGKVSVYNPTDNDIKVKDSSTLEVSGVTGFTCTFNSGAFGDGVVPAKGSTDIFYTCTRDAGADAQGCLADASKLVVTPKMAVEQVEINNVPGTVATPTPGSTTTIYGQKVKLTDAYEANMYTSAGEKKADTKETIDETKLSKLSVEVTSTDGSPLDTSTLGAVVLNADKVIANKGTVYVKWANNTEENTFKWPLPSRDYKQIDNTANLYIEGTDKVAPIKLDAGASCKPDSGADCRTAKSVAILKVYNENGAVGLLVRKAQLDDGVLVAGSEFSIKCQDESGNFTVEKALKGLDNYKPASTQNSVFSHFETNGEDNKIPQDTVCQLVEKKAAPGRSLLPEPVYFKYHTEGNQTTLQLLYKGTFGFAPISSTPSYLKVYEKGTTEDVFDGANPKNKITQLSSEAMIEVRDPERGRLPASGGQGIIVAMMLGVSLCGAAIVLRRRYQQL